MSALGASGKMAAAAMALTAGSGVQAAEVFNAPLTDVVENGQSVGSLFDISSFLTGPSGQRFIVTSAVLRVQGYSPYGTTSSTITGYQAQIGFYSHRCGWSWCRSSYTYYTPIYSPIDGVQDTLVVSLGEISGIGETQSIGSPSSFYGDLVANLVLGDTDLMTLNSSGQLQFTSTANTNTRINLVGASLNFELQNAPAVPEPATWSMMILGFGTVGAAMRSGRTRRKRVALA